MNFHQVGLSTLLLEPFQETQFDVLDWYPRYQSCVRFFHDQAQHTRAVQAVAAMVNILLPCQRSPDPPGQPAPGAGPAVTTQQHASLVPYVRRLVATGFDSSNILRGFFGDDWASGIGPLHENERKNYLFAAKSDTWLKVKASYDLGDSETVPFLRPLQNVTEKEIQTAEANWSEWLAMQDWMLGPRAPEGGAVASRGSR